jgi:hypothetical protein
MLDTPPRKLTLLPTSAGEPTGIPAGPIENFYSAEWLPGGKRILLTGSEPGKGLRCYIQDLAAGVPVPKTPEGTYGCLISPDAKLILAQGPKEKVSLYRAADGRLLSVAGTEPKDQPIRFDKDGNHLYVYQYEEGAAEAEIYRLDTRTGRREPWRGLKVPDPVVDSLDSVLLTPDGRWHTCTYRRTLSDLYLVEGLK